MNTDIENFHRDGYVLLKNHIPKDVIEILSNHHNRVFPDFKDGLDQNPDFSRDIPLYQKHVVYDDVNKTRIDGVPLEHRIFRGQGSPNVSETPNVYYGKRISKNLKDIDVETFNSIFYKDLLNVGCKLLDTDGLSYLEGSANRTYPRYPGYPTRPHIDTYGFTYGNHKILNSSNFFINALFYIDGTDQGRAPTQIFPGSHKRYDEMNKITSKALGLASTLNRIHQAELYWELLPDDMRSSVIYVDADPGDVLVINSNIVHTISGNDSYDRHRDVVILNFARKGANHFGKMRSERDFKYLADRLAPLDLGLGNNQSSNLLLKVKDKAKIIGKKIIKKTSRNSVWKDKNVHRMSFDEMPYLNLGSGTNWIDAKTLGLDINGSPENFGNRVKCLCDVEFDLSSTQPLPFEDSRFDAVYSSHCVEHLNEQNAAHVFKEVQRVLKKDGIFRITCPNIDLYFDNYDNKNLSFFNWIRTKNIYAYDSWLRFITREFAGAVVDNYSDEQLLELYNQGRDAYLNHFQREQNQCNDKSKNIPDIHKSFWTPKKMSEFLKQAGFRDVLETERFGSRVAHFADSNNSSFNYTRPQISLYVEAVK